MLKLSRALAALACVGALVAGAGCTAAPQNGSGAEPGQLTVITAFYPLQFVTERVAGTHAKVETLTQPGSEPHDLELTPKQIGSLSSASLVVYEKGFQAAVDQAVANSGNANSLDVTTVAPLEKVAESEHEHDHEGEGKDGHDEHDHGDLDPHVWLDPTKMAAMATAVADKLAALDPGHAADYRANLATLTTELTTLDSEFTTGLATCDRTEFITSHAAFGYLAKRYKLTQIGISGLSPDAEPSPARIAEIHTEAKEHGITTIFYETLVSPAVAKAVAGDLGLRTDVLDPLEGITPESRGSDYLTVMRANLAALRTANGCS